MEEYKKIKLKIKKEIKKKKLLEDKINQHQFDNKIILKRINYMHHNRSELDLFNYNQTFEKFNKINNNNSYNNYNNNFIKICLKK